MLINNDLAETSQMRRLPIIQKYTTNEFCSFYEQGDFNIYKAILN